MGIFGKKKKDESVELPMPLPPEPKMQIQFDYKMAYDLRTKIGIDMPSVMKMMWEVLDVMGENATPIHRRYILSAGVERYLAELRVKKQAQL